MKRFYCTCGSIGWFKQK